MEKKKEMNSLNDIGGKAYSFFLHFMLFSQMGLFVNDVLMDDIFFCFIHLVALFYFILRLHVFNKMRNRAYSAGYTIVDYLRGKYGG